MAAQPSHAKSPWQARRAVRVRCSRAQQPHAITRRTFVANTLVSSAQPALWARADEGDAPAQTQGSAVAAADAASPDDALLVQESQPEQASTTATATTDDQQQQQASIFVYPEDQPDGEPISAREEANALTLTANDRQLLEYNRRIQELNGVPLNFPSFVRNGFEVRVLAPGPSWVLTDEGLLYTPLPGEGIAQGNLGKTAQDGQEITFHYIAYNENGRTIDSTFRRNEPARTRLGEGSGMIPGFEVALRRMAVGDRWRLVVPPALGPPVGPSTFFSAKQYEVFDVELLDVRSCVRKSSGMVSTLVCE